MPKGKIKSDPDRFQPLIDMPIRENTKALQRLVGMLAYYAKWIPEFSRKIRDVTRTTDFPLSEKAVQTCSIAISLTP